MKKQPDFLRVPPHNNNAEISILGAVLLDQDCLYEINLNPEDFYKEAHVKIFKTMSNMLQADKKIDSVTLVDELMKLGLLEEVGGAYYISTLQDEVYSTANLDNWVKIVKEKSELRKLIILGKKASDMAYETHVKASEIVSDVLKGVELIGSTSGGILEPVRAYIDDFLQYAEKVNKREIKFYPTGYSVIDDIKGGFQEGNLVIIGARTSVGKTALAQNIAINMDENDIPVVFYSFEMLKHELMVRHLQIKTQQNYNFLNDDDLKRAVKNMAAFDCNIVYNDDTENSNLSNLTKSITIANKKLGSKVFVVDYLQLMRAAGEKKLEQMENITRSLKILANKLGVLIILLSQVNRAGRDEPKLSDLKHAGSIEEDADIVLLLHTPEEEKKNAVRLTDLYIAKYRGGRVDRDELFYRGETTTFREKDMYHYEGVNF